MIKNVPEFINYIADNIFKIFDDSVLPLFVPIRDDTRIECINPKYIIENNEEIKEKIDALLNRLEEMQQMKVPIEH